MNIVQQVTAIIRRMIAARWNREPTPPPVRNVPTYQDSTAAGLAVAAAIEAATLLFAARLTSDTEAALDMIDRAHALAAASNPRTVAVTTEAFLHRGVSYSPAAIRTLVDGSNDLLDAYALQPPDVRRLTAATKAADALPLEVRMKLVSGDRSIPRDDAEPRVNEYASAER